MNTALFATPGVFAPLHGLWRWLVPVTAHQRLVPFSGAMCPSESSIAATPNTSSPSSHRTLRVVRILEADQAPTHVGRMVISGRMADVCAELDRLAAREAALH